jgi:hypothetical protein
MTHLVAFTLGRRPIRVRAPDAATAGAIASLVPGYAGSANGADPDDVRVERDPSGAWLARFPEGDARFETLDDLLEALEYLLTLRLLASATDRVHLHAAGAVVNGRAVLALGPSGSGKSSLALHWSLSGYPVLGDDIVMADETGLVHPFKRLFSVHRARLAACGLGSGRPADGSADVEDEAWFDPATRAGWAEPAPVGVVAMVRFVDHGQLSVGRLSRPTALAALTAGAMPSGAGGSQAFETALRLTASASTLALTFGKAEEAALALARAVTPPA